MSWTQWFIFLLIIQIIHGLGTWKLYTKAGRKAWEAFVPVYNAVILMKIISRQWWWVILLFLPIVNLIMIPAVWVETARAYGKDSKVDAFLCIITLGFYIYYLNYVADVAFIKDRKLTPKTSAGEWITSILFAIVAATIVHTYFFQPFVIPSSSLEKSLLVGDFLIVSKLHYGPRAPMTTVGAPMVHDTIPVLNAKSYLFDDNFEARNTSWKNKLQLPYLRLPGFETIERNDIVVFNQPADTLLDMNNFTPNRNYYKPIDKKTNLVKRCVGVAGDTLEIRNGYVFINGVQNKLPSRAKLQFSYEVSMKQPITTRAEEYRFMDLLKKIGVNDGARLNPNTGNYRVFAATDEEIAQLKIQPNIKNVEPVKRIKGEADEIFPRDPNYNWNVDFFGPVFIPAEGATVNLNSENISIYKRAISEYEGHEVVTRGNQIFIDGQPSTAYTFKQDYYWMMGDNRHNSIDSRYWGFVPFNHTFGKPVFIWMSIDGINDGIKNWSIRWDRVFTTVSGNGERTSYLIPFLIFVVGLTFFNKWRKKKKAKA
ncbi:signal peptidase I [uncultured Winogradskyella sp.]|uniref:signal peptidase I n=1 Tax=uncultured Winogradskyella sp. TaxID=395353 RepID=UPI0030DB795A|tara:strand:- start:145822 stop:147438 length:1617 start_codon:yes stop_codon:yes gene_type:complete